VLTTVERNEILKSGGKLDPSNPAAAFTFLVEEKIVCSQSKNVKYAFRADNSLQLNVPLERATNLEESGTPDFRPKVPLAACLHALGEPEEIPDFYSSAAKARVTAIKTTRLATFPDILTLSVRRFVLGNGIPKKLDVFIDAPQELHISSLRAHGKLPGEVELPEEEAPAAPEPTAEEHIVVTLEDMGFPRVRCVKAALATKNAGTEEAMNWLMEHMDDIDIDVPPVQKPKPQRAGSSSAAAAEPPAEAVQMLEAMGFTVPQCRKALRQTDNNVERAADWLFSHPDELDTPESAPARASSSDPKQGLRDGPGKYKLLGFISHIGTHTGSGHYVCHIQKDGQWVIFNDRKVALSEEPPFDMGYIYFYRRVV